MTTWIAAKEGKGRWRGGGGGVRKRGMRVRERKRERELRYNSRVSSGWLCNVHNTGVVGDQTHGVHT